MAYWRSRGKVFEGAFLCTLKIYTDIQHVHYDFYDDERCSVTHDFNPHGSSIARRGINATLYNASVGIASSVEHS
jgi:hypothetical protein